jgi:hypothetical protein
LRRHETDKSFLVLFFKKEQRFFLKKEAKTFCPFGGVLGDGGFEGAD